MLPFPSKSLLNRSKLLAPSNRLTPRFLIGFLKCRKVRPRITVAPRVILIGFLKASAFQFVMNPLSARMFARMRRSPRPSRSVLILMIRSLLAARKKSLRSNRSFRAAAQTFRKSKLSFRASSSLLLLLNRAARLIRSRRRFLIFL